jgi:3-oxoacyl-[acyl-carrier protein] reductase
VADKPLAVVTGASRGLGRYAAIALARAGAQLLLVARDAAALAQVAGEIGGAAVLSLDIATADAPARIAAEAARLGGADVLINNAAIQGPIGLMTEVDWDALEHTFRVDFLAPMALSRALAPQMIAKGAGWIVNISGGGATGPRPMFVAYGAAKTALVRASETLAAELAPLGIRVNAIAPGAFRSGMTLETLAAGGAAGAKEESVAKNLVDKDDDQAARRAAALIAYLAAGAGRDVSGRLISAVWDPWETLHERAEDLLGSDIYTLRRITPGDRGKDWGG